MNYLKLNALKQLARDCNSECKKARKAQAKPSKALPDADIRVIFAPYQQQAKLLGFTNLELNYQIGLQNNKFIER